jgi:integrase
MPTARITKRSVDVLTPGSADVFLWDEVLKGFGLRLTPKGARSYVVQYRMGGREAPSRRYTIGSHGSPWTPETARREAERILIMVRQGTDPVDAKNQRRREAVDLAFDSYVESFSRLYLKKRWKDWKLGEGVLRREVVPQLRNKPLPRIARSDLAPIWDRLDDRPAVGRLTHATLRKLFRWAVARGDLDRSPMEGLAAPAGVPARDRVLTDEELAILWKATNRIGRPFGPLFRLLILTGQRREEVAGMDWSELDRGTACWLIPAYRTKNRKAQLVPLSSEATRVIDEIAGTAKWPRSGYVFSTTGKTPVSGFSKAKRRLDELMSEALEDQFSTWRAHDIRRTLATGLQRLGVRFEVTEAVLNHVSGSRSGVAGVYQRYDWAAEKRAALDGWARHLQTIQVRVAAGDNPEPTQTPAHAA